MSTPKPPADAGTGPELVAVLETNNQIQLALAKGLIEDAGIPLYIQGQIATLIQEVDGLLHKWVRLQVPRERADEARELLGPILRPADAGAAADAFGPGGAGPP
ncbi:MAG: DUF2007 domain-containing protein [Acidobacteriota bacterium]|nr:DUF2007 domain-containing protein [Acidobacteriota bacterium]